MTDGTPTIGGNSSSQASHEAHATAAATLVRDSGMGLIPVIVNTGTTHVNAAFLQSLVRYALSHCGCIVCGFFFYLRLTKL